MGERDYTELAVRVSAQDREAAEAAATMLCPAGFQTEDYSDFAAFTADLPPELVDAALKQKPKDSCVIKLYIPAGQNAAAKSERLSALLANAGVAFSLEHKTINEADWADVWKQYFHPFHIGSIVVCPSWELYAGAPGDKVLKIDPGMAFGTGQHETTRLCIELLLELVTPGCRLLDMGCGSGILSIAALLLGAESALGVDIDGYALERARDNAALNDFGPGAFSTLCGDAAADPALRRRIGGGYDLIAANIVADVLIAQAPLYAAALKPGGALVASGIIEPRLPEVLAAFSAAGLTIEAQRTLRDWVALHCSTVSRQPTE